MDRFDAIVQGHLSKATEKREALERKTKAKKDYLDPEFAFNINNIDYVDADSVFDRSTGQEIRLTGEGGRGYDSYESIPQGYDTNPLKEIIHKRSYADANGLRVDQVTREMLLAKGKVQSNQFKARLLEAADENGNIRYRHKGRGEYGRILAEISYDGAQQKLLDDMGSRDENAGYKGDFNFVRQLEDFESGDTVEHNRGRGKRSYGDLAKDQAIGLAAGTADMATGLAQSAAIAATLGDETADFFEDAREGTQNFREKFQSPEKLRGDRMAQKRSQLRQDITSMKKAQYVAQGDSEIEAGLKAGIGEYTDTVKDFWQHPGRALDAMVESLPYMIGVGATGAAAARIASNKLRKTMAKDFAEFASRGKGIGPATGAQGSAEIGAAVQKFMVSPAAQKEIRDIVGKVGIGTVGITEGMTNAADVYGEIMKLSEEDAGQSEAYRSYRREGLSHKEALHELGTSAWAESIVATTILATAAAAGTGAGVFEATMFTGLRKPGKAAADVIIRGGKPVITKPAKVARAKNIKKIRKAREAEELGLKGGIVKKVATGAGVAAVIGKKVVKSEAVKAGGKEFVEESIQSGGGELVGQIAKQEATGEEIGPGVGEATAEGGIVGFLSGLSLGGATSGIKAGARKILNDKPEFEQNGPVEITDETTPVLGGSPTTGDRASQNKNYSGIDSLKKTLATLATGKSGNITNYYYDLVTHVSKAIEEYNEQLIAADSKGDTKEVEKLQKERDELGAEVKQYHLQYITSLQARINKDKPEIIKGNISVSTRNVIEELSSLGVVIDPEILAKLDNETTTLLAQNGDLHVALAALQKAGASPAAMEAELRARDIDPESPKGQKALLTMELAHYRKMGPTRFEIPNSRGKWVRGVQKYISDLSEAIQEGLRNGKDTNVRTIVEQFSNFLVGQQNKIDQLKKHIEDKPKFYKLHVDPSKPDERNTQYTFTSDSARALLAVLEQEQAEMKNIEASFLIKEAAFKDILAGKSTKVESVPESEPFPGTEEAPSKLETLKKTLGALKPKALRKKADSLKEKGFKYAKGVNDNALTQAVAEFMLALENKPEGSDADKEEATEETPEAFAAFREEKGIKPLSAPAAQAVASIAEEIQNTENLTGIKYSGTGSQAKNAYVTWVKAQRAPKRKAASRTAAKKTTQTPARIAALKARKDAANAFNAAIIDFARKNQGDAFDESTVGRIRQVIADDSILSRTFQDVGESTDESENAERLNHAFYPDNKIELDALTKLEDAKNAANFDYITELRSPAKQAGRVSAEASEGSDTKEKVPLTLRDSGIEKARAAAADAFEANPKLTSTELGTALREGRKGLIPGPVKQGYLTEAKKLYNRQVNKEAADTTRNNFDNTYTGLRNAYRQSHAISSDEVTAHFNAWQDYLQALEDTLTPEVNAAVKEARKSLNPNTETLTEDTEPAIMQQVFEQEKDVLQNVVEGAIQDFVGEFGIEESQNLLTAFTATNKPSIIPLSQEAQVAALESNPDNIETEQADAPVGPNNVLFELRGVTRGRLTKVIKVLEEELGDSTDVPLQKELSAAKRALEALDSPTESLMKSQELASEIADVIERRLRSEDYYLIKNKPHLYRNALGLLAEMGVTSNSTVEFRAERDALLETLLTTIDKDVASNTDLMVTSGKVLTKVYAFIAANPEHAPNAFMADGVRFSNFDKLNSSAGTVTQVTASKHLPTRLMDAFVKAGDKAASLLAVYPNYRTKLHSDYQSMDENLDTFAAVGSFLRFEDKFRNTLLDTAIKWGPDSISNNSIFAYEGNSFGQYLLEDPMWYFRDSEGEINENLITAMALEAFKYIGGAGQRTLENKPDEVARILKMHKGYTPNDLEMKMLGHVGDGIENVYDLLASELMKHINIKGTGLTTGQLRSVMPRVLAARTVSTLSVMGLVNIHPVEMNDINEEGEATETYERRFVRLATREVVPGEVTTPFTWDINFLTNMAVVLNKNGTLVDMFGAVAKTGGPSNVPFEEVEKKIRRTVMTAPKTTSEASKKDQDRPYTFNSVLQNALSLFPTPEDYLQINHNYAPTLQAVHQTKVPNIRGRNQNFINEYESGTTWVDQLIDTGTNEFYLPNRNITNLRTMIVSVPVNGQSSKVHRPLFPKLEAMQDYPVNMTSATARGNPEQTAFYRAVAQKLGGKLIVEGKKVKIEFLTDTEILDNIDILIADWQTLIDHINNPDHPIPDGGKTVFSQNQLQDFLDAELYNEENGETFMTLANLAVLQKNQDAPQDGVTTLHMYQPIQTDSTTSGFANSLLQLVTRSQFTKIKIALRRIGAAFTDDPSTATEFLANNSDSYETITEILNKVIGNMREGITSTVRKNDKEGRITTSKTIDALNNARGELQKIEEGTNSAFPDVKAAERMKKFWRNRIRILSIQNNEILRNLGTHTFGIDPKGKNISVIPELVEADGNIVTSAGRQFAKDPFMLGNYNAGRASAKRALAANSYSAFLDILANIDDPAQLQGVIEVLYEARNEVIPILIEAQEIQEGTLNIVEPAQIPEVAAKVVADIEALREHNYAEQEKNLESRQVVNLGTMLDFPLEVQRAYQTIISDTYGEALHVALDSELIYLKEPRDQIHAMAFTSNAIFQEILKKRVEDFTEVQGLYPDHTQIKRIVDELVNENLFPGVASAVSEEMDDRIEAVKRESAALFIRGAAVRGEIGFEGAVPLITKVHADGEIEIIEQKSISFPIEDRAFKDDVGVAPGVRAIQAIEAVIQSDLLQKYALTNTYDGQGAEGTTSRLIARDANTAVIQRNHNYNMYSAFYENMVSMLRALHPTSAQLSAETKQSLMASIAAKHNYRRGTPEEAFGLFLGNINRVHQDVNEGRKLMWEAMRTLQNYIESPESEVFVQQALQNEVAPVSIFDTTQPTLDALVTAYNAHINNVDQDGTSAEVKARMTSSLVQSLSNGLNSATDTLQAFMRADSNKSIGTGYLMTLLSNALRESGGNPNLTGLVSRLQDLVKGVSDIKSVRIHLSEVPLTGYDGSAADGLYTPRKGGNTARIDVWTEAPYFISTVLHEVFHAVTGNYINEAEAESPATFQEMVSQATTMAKAFVALENTPQNATQRVVGATLELILKRGTLEGQKAAVSEMISHVTATFIENKNKTDIDLPFLSQFDAVFESLRALIILGSPDVDVNRHVQSSAAQATAEYGIPEIHENSSSEEIDTIDFLKRNVTQLPGQQIERVLKTIEELDPGPPNPKHNKRLDTVINGLLLPSTPIIDDLIVKISTNPNGARNLGQVLNQDIYLESAGNRLTSNIDLSLKEVAVHEYLHPIVRWALGQSTDANGKKLSGDWNIQQRLRKLFETARDNIDPLDFMPRAPSGNIQYAQQQARERYDYIFNNPKGDMSEFLINGLVNEQLISLLAAIDAPNTTQPVWEGFTYKSLVNITGRIMRLFTSKVRKSKTGKIGAELDTLAGNIVTLNIRNTAASLHKTRQQPILDTANGWFANQIGEKVAEPLKKWSDKFAPEPGKKQSLVKTTAYVAINAVLEAGNEDFQKAANEYFRELNGQKNNTIMELAAELMPSQKSLKLWKEQLRKSNLVVDRARRVAIEHMQKSLRQHFDPDRRHKLRRADKAALTHVGMRADLSALLGPNNNWERLQRLVNNSTAVDAEIITKQAELDRISQGDTQLYNVLHNQTLGLAEIMVIGQTFRANVQTNPYMIANQHFFSDPKHKRPLADVDGAIAIIDELKTLFALKLINETAPQDMETMARIVNHEMNRNLGSTPNGFQMFMSRHVNFKEQALERSFKGNPAQMTSGYVYEQYNPDIDIKFTTESPAEVKAMVDKNYFRIGMLPRDPADPLRQPMIIWKGLNGHAMYMKTIVSYTGTEARGHDPFDSLRLQQGMSTSSAGVLAQYNIHILRKRMETDVLKQLQGPDVKHTQARSVPVHDDKGNITNYRYMMSQNNKKGVLEANQDFDYLLGRMFGSLEDRENTININRDTAKLLHAEYTAGQGVDKTLRFVEISKFSKDPKAREMWNLMPTDMREELTKLFGGEHFFIRDDAINLILGFRKASISNMKWLGKKAFTVRAAERIWFDVIRLLKIKIVLTMPDVVLGNMAANIAFLLGEGIPLPFIQKEFTLGLKGIYTYQKDVEALHNLEQEMQATKRTRGAVTPKQINQRENLRNALANNPIATLAEEGVFTGIADELEPDTWNWRNKILNWVGEISDSYIPAAAVGAAKEVLIVPGSETFKVALAATQYADFISRHIKFKYDTDVRGHEKEYAIQEAIDNFIYYDVPQNVWLQLANDYGFAMFTKYFLRIPQRIFRLYKNHPLTALSTLGLQKMTTGFPFSSNITDYAMWDNFNFQSRLHMFPWRTMDGADMLTPALPQILLYPFGGDR